MARRSFSRNLLKWGAGGHNAKPVALLTGFVEDPRDAAGNVPADRVLRRTLNRARNESLRSELAQLGMSYYPVIGAGQSRRRLLGFPYIAPSEEESFVVQPHGEMEGGPFLNAIQQLLVKYGQYAAAMRIPAEPSRH